MTDYQPPTIDDLAYVMKGGGGPTIDRTIAQALRGPVLDELCVSDDSIREHAYLVARGVRPLAIVDHCRADPGVMLGIASRIEALACEYGGGVGCIPFVVERRDGVADYGFAANRSVLDLFQWLQSSTEEAVPAVQQHRLLGLLLGYSPAAIRDHDELVSGRRFRPTAGTETR